MSQLMGASGSLSMQTYVQPASALGPAPGIIAMGNYLGPGAASLGVDDPSRQRSTAYVLPRQIELMEGFFNVQDMGGNSNNSDMNLNSSMTMLVPATQATYPGMTAVGPSTHGHSGHGGAYGLTYTGSVTPQNCLQHTGCSLNTSGGCHCTSGPFYSPHGTNTYY